MEKEVGITFQGKNVTRNVRNAIMNNQRKVFRMTGKKERNEEEAASRKKKNVIVITRNIKLDTARTQGRIFYTIGRQTHQDPPDPQHPA